MADLAQNIFTKKLEIKYEDRQIPAVLTTPNRPRDQGIVFTHGAGGDMDTPQVALICEGLSKRGFTVLRFTCKSLNLKYRTKVYAEVVKYFKMNCSEVQRCLVGGRSMGSRAAVEVANQLKGTEFESFVQGVICVSYPLYPPGSPEKIRDAPLYDLCQPSLFVSGDRDDMCEKKRLIDVLDNVKNSSVCWLENADHSLVVRSSGLENTVQFVIDKICNWHYETKGENQNNAHSESRHVIEAKVPKLRYKEKV
ncbi:testis-expressed protein 30-like [Haliotis rubra]|uniref:testis-expressed protein 30-like n=1 Tax=Haliotis rubra TaxID=36100 RepID=UPI001EE5EEB4|nr:testis-expressed protein 30-like [Haliotis rubra]